jgi:predicted nucleotidyltransferase
MPTPYADLNAVLAELVSGAREILGENFCGAYLQGSFAVGDADEHSDVDFLVVVHDELTDAQQAALEALHERLYAIDTPWAQHLEGSYVPKIQLRRMSPERPPWFYFDNGATEPIWDNHDNSAVVRWSLREHGVVLAGADPKTLVDPISAAEIRADALVAVAEWEEWLPTLDSWSARLQPLVVLSYCRILNTLESCVVMSKRQAGEWALGALDKRWRELIQLALDDRPDPWSKVRRRADPEAVARTRAFVEYAAGLARRYEGTRSAAR